MSQSKHCQILLGSCVTEKSIGAFEKFGQMVFKVLPSATKIQIKAAVEKLFNVTVEAVHVINVAGKQKRGGRRSSWKKAFVTLEKGQNIQISNFEV